VVAEVGMMIEWIKDKWLTWRTGKTKAEREWSAWYDKNINWLSPRISTMFEKFKHVIVVDTHKFMDPYEPMAWVPCNDAKQYFWPERELGNNAVWRFERVIPYGDNDYYVNGMGDRDLIFVATNSDKDAMMITLKYT
jgi:hypothetical protein